VKIVADRASRQPIEKCFKATLLLRSMLSDKKAGKISPKTTQCGSQDKKT
jgi:hypothetical protein